ncbi:MAG TPA: glycosyltransferase [Leptolyngbyaceae cyanobacterium]
MNTLFLIIGIVFLIERIWKYTKIQQFFQSAPNHNITETNQTISILQPILSGDPTLWDCLAKNLQMKTNYQTEFIWLIDEDDWAALDGCEKLINQYPHTNVRLISLPLPSDGISPKTFKLIVGLKESKSDIVVVLDDDTILPDYGLEECLPYLNQPDVGLAFGLPYYINFSNFWSSLVSCFVNGNSLLTYIPYTFLIHPFTINGMFYAIKKDVLVKIGGFAGLENAICDDYAMAKRFRSQGYLLAQTPLRHGISTQVENASHYFNILNRWLIFPQASIMKSATIGELSLFYTLVLLPNFFPLLTVIYLLVFPSIYSLVFSLLYFGFNAYMMIDLNRKYLNKATPNNKMIWILLIQIILPFQIIASLLSPRKINWRGHIMEINREGGFKFVQRRQG